VAHEKAYKNIEFSDGKYKWDNKDIDIAYRMAEEELGFDPKYVNRQNILKFALMSKLSDKTNLDFKKVGDTIYDIYAGDKNITNKDLNILLKILDDHKIYTKNGKNLQKNYMDLIF